VWKAYGGKLDGVADILKLVACEDARGSPGRAGRKDSMTGVLTRRGLLGRGAAALAALAVPGLASARRTSPKTAAVFRLDPRSERCGGGLGSCAACVGHDAHSLFPSMKAANGNRAHNGCDCCIVAGTLHYGTFVALFGNPDQPTRYRADTRDHRTKAVLSQHPPQFPS
jgi:hypothetical protein